MAKVKTKTFTVEGRGSFPLDMLRYDSCWPYSSSDAMQIKGTGRRMVCLVTDKPYAPTVGRWNSFLWSVIEEAL